MAGEATRNAVFTRILWALCRRLGGARVGGHRRGHRGTVSATRRTIMSDDTHDPDFTVTLGAGGTTSVKPHTEAAHTWAEEYLGRSREEWLRYGSGSFGLTNPSAGDLPERLSGQGFKVVVRHRATDE
jgi:hypothetical protein